MMTREPQVRAAAGAARLSGAARLLMLVVTGYQRGVSWLLMPRCRFAPSWNAPVRIVIPKKPSGRGTRISLRLPGKFTLM